MAPTPIDEDADLELAGRLVFPPKLGLRLERFTRSETLAGRTPDFRVFQGDSLIAFAEVKSPRDDWLEEQLAAAPPGEIVGGLRADSTFNRLARHINKAAQQFDAVNPDREHINVLIFVNHAADVTHRDLIEVVTGHFRGDSGTDHPTMLHISDGIIASAKRRIDLIAWIDAPASCLRHWVYNGEDPDRRDFALNLLHI